MPKFETQKFGLPNTEMPEAFREMAEKGSSTRGTRAKAKERAKEAYLIRLKMLGETAASVSTDLQ